MRTYGRLNGKWVIVQTDASGDDTAVWITTLVQCLKLFLNESPFYAQYGIPAKDSILQQIAPDYYVSRTQQQFSSFFASLVITRRTGVITPTYDVALITKQGATLQFGVAV